MSVENEDRTVNEREMGAAGEAVHGRVAPDRTEQPSGERARVVEPAAPAETIDVPETPDPVLSSVLAEDWGRDIAGDEAA